MGQIKLLKNQLANTLTIQAAPHPVLTYWRSPHETPFTPSHPAIFLNQSTYHRINQHLDSLPNLQLGGMLLGNAHHSPSQKTFIVIEAILEAQYVQHSPAHLTFTAHSWVDMLERRDTIYADKQILGWYHSHPKRSIFLSEYDLWLHHHFFRAPWQVALVVDTQAHHAGFFSYKSAKPNKLDPIAYRGFYEIGEVNNSIITWLNLEATEPNFADKLWQNPRFTKDGNTSEKPNAGD